MENIKSDKIRDVINFLKNEKNIKFLIVNFGSIMILYSVIVRLLDISYKISCQNYYKLPFKYFSIDLTPKISVLMAISIMISIFISEKYFSKGEKVWNRIFNLIYSSCLSLIFSVLSIAKLIYFFKLYKIESFIREYEKITFILVFIITTSINYIAIDFIKKRKAIRGTIRKETKIKKILNSISMFIFICIVIVPMLYPLFKGIADKKDYEIFYADNEIKVIISEYKDKFIVKNGIIENNKLIIYGSYDIILQEVNGIEYKSFSKIEIK